VAREGVGGGWAGLSGSVSDGAAWQAHAKSPCAQVRLELLVCQATTLLRILVFSFANVTCTHTPNEPAPVLSVAETAGVSLFSATASAVSCQRLAFVSG